MFKTLAVVILFAGQVGAAEFTLNQAEVKGLREIPVPEVSAPAPVEEVKPCKMPGPDATIAEIIAWIKCVPLPPLPVADKGGATFFNCHSIDGNQPAGIEKINLTVSAPWDPMKLTFVEKNVTEDYYLAPGQTFNKPTSYLQLNAAKPSARITPFYMETRLMNGGGALERGLTGGYLKVLGKDKNWAFYLCTR